LAIEESSGDASRVGSGKNRVLHVVDYTGRLVRRRGRKGRKGQGGKDRHRVVDRTRQFR
jgi:hypothetical protein